MATHGLAWLDLGLGAASFLLVRYRRRFPMTIAIVLNLVGIFSATATGPSVLATVSLAARRQPWQIGVIGVIVVGSFSAFYASQPDISQQPTWIIALLATVAVATQIGWGLYIGSRRELIWALQRRVERAEAEQELRLSQARAAERTRIAQETHDALAHRLSQLSLHAAALSFRDDLQVDETRNDAELIRRSANAALTDLRQLVTMLRTDNDNVGSPDSPLPTYDDLPRLVQSSRGRGVRIDVVDELDCVEPVPDSLGRAVHRIVEEGIDNASRHAPGSPLTMEVTGDPGSGINVMLTNPLRSGQRLTPGPGSGLGLIGLAERVEIRGGSLGSEVLDGSFRLKGWLPWTP